MASRDYSDSEDESESRAPIGRAEYEGIERVAPKEGESSSKPTSNGLRIKLRPATARPPSHERSSLSPPPPLTLKFGLPPSVPYTSRPSKAERAAYSSSEDDEAGPSVPQTKVAKPKKPRVSRAKKRQLEESAALEPPVGQAAGRKAYDWLIPSFAGASHAGPAGRDMNEPAKKVPRLSDFNELEEPPIIQTTEQIREKETKRSHKKKRDSDVVGPGKAWRKGIKKGVMRPPRDTGIETPAASTPGNSRPGSVEGTPEEEEARPIHIHIEPMPTPDGPFVLADASQMNMPVFSKPIVAPKMILSQFPKVTPYFLPNNGGDSGPFPRREKTRSWKNSEREFVGIGGGTLKFKSWIKGPPGDLTNVLKAEKDLSDVRAKASKESTDNKSKPSKEKDITETKPKAAKEKYESKPKAPKDDKPKQPRTIAIAPRPRANSGSDATPPRQPQSNTTNFQPVQFKDTSAGPMIVSPIPEFNRELPAIPPMHEEGASGPSVLESGESFRPSVLEPVTPGGQHSTTTPSTSVYRFGLPPPPSAPDLSEPGWTSNGSAINSERHYVDDKGKTPSHVRRTPNPASELPLISPMMPDLSQPGWTSDGSGLNGGRHYGHQDRGRIGRASPKSVSKLPLYTSEPLGSPSPASGSQPIDVDVIEPGSAKAPRKSKLAQEIRPEEANAEQ